MSNNVKSVSRQNIKTHLLLGYCNLCPSQMELGKTSP